MSKTARPRWRIARITCSSCSADLHPPVRGSRDRIHAWPRPRDETGAPPVTADGADETLRFTSASLPRWLQESPPRSDAARVAPSPDLLSRSGERPDRRARVDRDAASSAAAIRRQDGQADGKGNVRRAISPVIIDLELPWRGLLDQQGRGRRRHARRLLLEQSPPFRLFHRLRSNCRSSRPSQHFYQPALCTLASA